jgi:N-acetyl-anhydromuramyl-L-alanine amidase AmpD
VNRPLLGALVLAALASRAEATQKPPVIWRPASPANYTNWSSRKIDRIIIHKAEGSAYATWNWFQNPAARASTQYCVDFDGTVFQMVDDVDQAWHGGNNSYSARSIGIENAGYIYRNDMTSAQYRRLAQLVAHLCEKYGIPKDRAHIIGHNEVPDPFNPGKWGGANHSTDPGPYFDWAGFMNLVRSFTNGSPTPAPAPGPTTTSARSALRTTVDLNVRSAAWGSVLAVAPTGLVFAGTGASDQGFTQVFYGGGRAFLYTAYLVHAQKIGARIEVDVLNARDAKLVAPSTLMGQVYRGQIYVSHGVDGDWRRVQFDTRKAWVWRAYTAALQLK